MDPITRRAFVASLLTTVFATGVAAKIPGLRDAFDGRPDYCVTINCMGHSLSDVNGFLLFQMRKGGLERINPPTPIRLLPPPVVEYSDGSRL